MEHRATLSILNRNMILAMRLSFVFQPSAVVGLVLLIMAEFCAGAEGAKGEFDETIAPILVERCLSCHSGPDPKGKLDLGSRNAALRGGDSGAAFSANGLGESLLWERVESGDMPPEEPLSKSERDSLRNWIQSGAVWGTDPIDVLQRTTNTRAGFDWWSLQRLKRPAVPVIAGAKTPVDAFVRRRLREHGLRAAPRSSPHELVRRLYFDLIGLPPSPDAMEAFRLETRSDADAALRSLTERLLASPQFGQRWARHWLDVVRFGESQGFERDKLREDSWYYRDWVIDAFNDDMPYDRFVRLQLAGDVLQPDDADAITATGFLVAGAWDEVGQSQRSQAMRLTWHR